MEDVLDVCHRPYDSRWPSVNLDEKPVQLLSDVREPLPQRPGEAARQDHEYKRNGTANTFVAFEPPANWRTPSVTERRTRSDFAHFVKELPDGRYPDAEKVVPVMDQLNTHGPASLYEAFAQLDLGHVQPRPVFGRVVDLQPSASRLASSGAKWAGDCGSGWGTRNPWSPPAPPSSGIATPDARTKLKRLYPTIEVS